MKAANVQECHDEYLEVQGVENTVKKTPFFQMQAAVNPHAWSMEFGPITVIVKKTHQEAGPSVV